MNVSKTPAEMGRAKISCCETEFLDVRRQGCSNKVNQRSVGGCISPPSAPASHTKPSVAPKIVIYSCQHPLCCLRYAERQICPFHSG